MRYFSILLLLTGCASQFAALQSGNRSQDIALEEVRIELGDIKHSLHAQEVEMRLLEEKVDQESGAKSHDQQNGIALLEKRLAAIERNQEKLSSHANQTTAFLTQYRDHIQEIDRRLDEALRLKATLQKQPTSKTHLVKSGDSLEKIARHHQTSVQTLKELNHLSSDRIVVGQQLQIPDE